MTDMHPTYFAALLANVLHGFRWILAKFRRVCCAPAFQVLWLCLLQRGVQLLHQHNVQPHACMQQGVMGDEPSVVKSG
jgi:hypothetical protein